MKENSERSGLDGNRIVRSDRFGNRAYLIDPCEALKNSLVFSEEMLGRTKDADRHFFGGFDTVAGTGVADGDDEFFEKLETIL